MIRSHKIFAILLIILNISYQFCLFAENGNQQQSLAASLQDFSQTVNLTLSSAKLTETTIAVYPFTQSAKSQINLSNQPLSNYLSSETTITLASQKTKNYRLLSRKKIQDLLSEQKL